MVALVRAVTRFVISLMRSLSFRDIPITFQDERMSTRAVESAMVAADLTRAKRVARQDALAACWILQSALDVVNNNQTRSCPNDTPTH